MTAPALVYDPRGHTFESWASLMCELYATQQLEVPSAMTDWRLWGEGLKAINIFVDDGVPGTSAFADWQEWAEALVNIVNHQQLD
jgi:hypothetical protein